MKIIKIVIAVVVLTLSVTAEEVLKNPFMWKVQKGEQSSYLFGTIHVPAPELSVLPAKVKSAINSCDGVRTELDMNFMNQMKATQLMLRKDGKTLEDILPKALYTRAEKALKVINPALNLKPFSELKVWALAATLELLEEQMKNPALAPIDDVIFRYGEEHNKSVAGIEIAEEQIGIFDVFSLNEQIEFLEATLDYMDEYKDSMKTMKELYIKGDSKALLTFLNEQFKDDKYKKLEEKFMEELLYKRNVRIAKRIDNLLKKDRKKSYFFAFGTMHFLDKKSVIEYLEGYGYKVVRVK
jgi:uncharacterized protein YbaP (TraB family)